MEKADFKMIIDGKSYEYTTNPREGQNSFHVGEQWIVRYNKKTKAIYGFDRMLRPDSPNKIDD